jgi:serine-type D-Ala-D-Ala carboxypeptidase/endopeptidase
MKITITSLLFFLHFYLPAQNGAALKQVIDRTLKQRDYRVDSAKVTGFVIGCLDGDSSWVFPYGQLSKTMKESPNGDTYFEIGGVSQVLIANQIHELVASKQLDYAMPINHYLPISLQFPLGERITLLQLVTHTSGLPKFPDDIGTYETDKEQPFEAYTEGSLFDYLKSFDTTNLSIGKYRYGHLNYVILEKVLKIKGVLTVEKDVSSYKIMAQGYNLAQKPVEPWRFNETFEGVVGRKMTVQQLLEFMQKQLEIKALHTDLFPTNLTKFTFVGKAWHILKQKKRPVICVATGATAGYSAFVAFVPETRTGVVILTNSRLIEGRLGLAILRILNENWKRK